MVRTKNTIVIRGSSCVSLNDRFSELLDEYSPLTSDPDHAPGFNMNPRRLFPRKSVTQRLGRPSVRSRLGRPVCSRLGRPVCSRLGRPVCIRRRRPVWTRLGRSVFSKRRRPVWTRLGHPAGSKTWFRPWLQRSWLRGRVFSLGGLWWNGANSMYSKKRPQRHQKPWAERAEHSQGDCEQCTNQLSCQAAQTLGGGAGDSFGTKPKVPWWKMEVTTKEDLDQDLEDYMSVSKKQLDKELDAYMEGTRGILED